ncbi:MAG TPA: NifB/NifX family molybdenum-iron cluster-binding protein [Candidatus Syntrophosphaera sp.]|jgi:predicted Fe-Mo cluster-binding NifX family protein|nr:NifB/NifX family molybdenum-iron cluster-binding protein [Candidatus Cloacimonadota bacterium]NLH92840.1 dinitrogenase iron-molybdenum cofactor biosynthesis protein [Candidatus Cloacimonadota bacterium]HPB44120.1 NifB/NifX family molybdenum-iron cluster-binding protein [Candidatus Syntrophosphaera sp.]HQP26594.1 NifB/NifX family molybdenum-iron cluster-binding protein [Candidatus Syntrophosphaera sp.]
MKIAFTSAGTNWDAQIDPRFGRADFIIFYDEEKDEISSFDNRNIIKVAHGAGPQTAQNLFEFKPQVLITGNGPGGNAAAILSQMDLRIFTGAGGMTVREAYEAYKNGKLPQSD